MNIDNTILDSKYNQRLQVMPPKTLQPSLPHTHESELYQSTEMQNQRQSILAVHSNIPYDQTQNLL